MFGVAGNDENPFVDWDNLDIPDLMLPTAVMKDFVENTLISSVASLGSLPDLGNEAATGVLDCVSPTTLPVNDLFTSSDVRNPGQPFRGNSSPRTSTQEAVGKSQRPTKSRRGNFLQQCFLNIWANPTRTGSGFSSAVEFCYQFVRRFLQSH
jgi:hypothetical protein